MSKKITPNLIHFIHKQTSVQISLHSHHLLLDKWFARLRKNKINLLSKNYKNKISLINRKNTNGKHFIIINLVR